MARLIPADFGTQIENPITFKKLQNFIVPFGASPTQDPTARGKQRIFYPI